MLHTSSDSAALCVYGELGSPTASLTDFSTIAFKYKCDRFGLPAVQVDSGRKGSGRTRTRSIPASQSARGSGTDGIPHRAVSRQTCRMSDGFPFRHADRYTRSMAGDRTPSRRRARGGERGTAMRTRLS